MTSTTSAPASTSSAAVRRRLRLSGAVAGLGVVALVVASCGGDDDDADASTTTTLAVETATPTTVAPTTTLAPTTTTTTLPPVDYVTEGATVVVANASGINGAAGRLTDRLSAVGFTMAAATNSSDTVGDLEVSQIYHVADDAPALAVAQSIKEGLGGGDIELLEVALPAPTESGELGDATVLVMMGNDIADKSLEELQGRVAPTTTADDTETTVAEDDTGGDETDDTTEEGGDDDAADG